MRLIDADALKTELEKLRDGWNYYGGEYESAMYQAYDISVDTVDEQPTVQSQRKKGKWIEIEIDAGEFIYKCTKCGMRVINPYKYCPMCGSYNGGGEDEVSD